MLASALVLYVQAIRDFARKVEGNTDMSKVEDRMSKSIKEVKGGRGNTEK